MGNQRLCGFLGPARDSADKAKPGLGAPNLLSAALYSGKFMRRRRKAWKGKLGFQVLLEVAANGLQLIGHIGHAFL